MRRFKREAADGRRQSLRRAGLGAIPPLGTAPKPAIANAKPVRSCESLAMVALPNTTIESAAVDPANPGICRVTAITTHPPAGDKVRIWVGIPTSNWNGRFLGIGGGGFSGGSAAGVNQPLALGYASGSTDTGHEGGSGSFALDANGRLNWQLIRDNAHVGIHEMTVTGKALTQAMYGVAPRYSYFNGCSTGGRQGLMEAQRYPEDYNGIVSGAPAINWAKFIPQELWGAVLMNAAGEFLSRRASWPPPQRPRSRPATVSMALRTASSKIRRAATTILSRSSALQPEIAGPSRRPMWT